MTEAPLVDAHVHVFTQDMPLVDNPRHAPTYSFTMEQLIATMDAHGVQFGVIAAASPWGDYNDYTIAALRAQPASRAPRGSAASGRGTARAAAPRRRGDGTGPPGRTSSVK